MKIGILGSGIVGQTLAQGLANSGHDVRIATGSSDRYDELQDKVGEAVSVGSFETVAIWCELAVLCVKGEAAEKIVSKLTSALNDKTIIDTTNPIDESVETQDGVLAYFTSSGESLMERLQALATQSHFVKAFNSVGSSVMVQPKFSSQPSMFICGNDERAKKQATTIIEELGWGVVDLGSARAAEPIEALCQLWCISGFRNNDWHHALRYLSN